MEESTGSERSIRLLGLGNEILADDAFGIWAAREVRRRYGGVIDVVTSSESGFRLMDHVVGARRLLVVDTIQTGRANPGTMHILDDAALRDAPGGSPHRIGLFEVIEAARALGLRVPRRVTILAVEAADCTTVGGEMCPELRTAVPLVADWVGRLLEDSR